VLKFKQQQLKAWQPILTPKPVIMTFVAVGIVFVVIGAVLFSESERVVEHEVKYSSECTNEFGDCNITVDLPEMKAPVFFYYKLENFYQNHRRYVKSRNDNQLRGLEVTYGDLDDCLPLRTSDGSEDDDKILYPCGLIAFSQFNDSFALWDEKNKVVPWQSQDISWEKDREKKFINPPEDTEGVRVIPDFKNEDFIVWMRTAGLPVFRKLHRKMNFDIPEGKYTLQVKQRFPVSDFDGKKSVVFSTTTWVGGKNPFLGIAYIVVGGLCLLQGLGFLAKHLIAPRVLGDTKFLDNN
jgi:cell cycle control protein 50